MSEEKIENTTPLVIEPKSTVTPKPEVVVKTDAKKIEPKKVESVFETPPSSIFKKEPLVTLYKLHLYQPNGNLRHSISKANFTELSKQYADIVRNIPSTRWSTTDEICDYVWAFEQKSYLRAFNRSRKQIEDGIAFGVGVGAILSK